MPSLIEIQAIHDQPLPDLVKAAAALHRARWEVSRARIKNSCQIEIGACDKGCERCGQESLVPPAKQEEDVLAAAKAAREAGQNRFYLPSSPGREGKGDGFESTLALIRKIRVLGLEVCTDREIEGLDEARKLKEAGCSILCHRFRIDRSSDDEASSPCFSQGLLQGIQAALESGLKVCFSCLMGQRATAEERLCFLYTLASGGMRPDIMHIRLPDHHSEGFEPLPSSEVIRFIATARILLPDCRLHLALERQRLDYRSMMMAHLCGANTIEYIPHRRDWEGMGSYADQTYLPMNREP